jgi:hypothetical protein
MAAHDLRRMADRILADANRLPDWDLRGRREAQEKAAALRARADQQVKDAATAAVYKSRQVLNKAASMPVARRARQILSTYAPDLADLPRQVPEAAVEIHALEAKLQQLTGRALQPAPPLTKAAPRKPDTAARKRELLEKAEAATDPTLRAGYRELLRQLEDDPKEK